ncbi:hypothetical protein LSH36_715g01006 [Paralvinella palmiformis]|uniref:ShKT domain-containing protein n=1 Tax=Paralvinella palmiformis TaxID=53620 RepID=A0AAD9MT95_9ANNE|nr:hypothetical protein LSH36_715g01006 [Paralvinella palmiformis]
MRAAIFACSLFILVVGTESNLVRLGSGLKGPEIGRQDAPLDRMTLEIPVDGTVVVLELRRSDAVSSDVPVLLGTSREAFVLWQGDPHRSSDFVLYVDQKKQASFVMWDRNTDTDRANRGIMGVFHFRGSTYTVEPMDGRMESGRPAPYPAVDDDNEPVMIELNGVRLSMTRVDRKESSVSGTGLPLTQNASQRQEELRRFLREHPEDMFGKFTYEVEILVVLDHSIFKKWVKKSRSFDYRTREVEAIENIRYYFTEVINGVALRYGLMSEHRIRLRPIGFYIAKSDDASYWTELPPIKRNYHFTEAGQALDELKRWLHRHEGELPPFDYAMLFTENALVTSAGSRHGADGPRIISGLSDVMGVCQYSKASLCHDGGLAVAIETASWELGNTLGAYDDDACQEKTAKSSAGVREMNSDYPLQMSACSKKALWGYLYYLQLNRTNCLLNRDNHDAVWNPVKFVLRYPGERYTSDEQCQLAHGIHSFSCTDGNKDGMICGKMHCWMPYYGRCESSPSVVASNGTPCGDDVWCMGGQCIPRPDPRGFNDTECAYGDYQGVIDAAKGYKCYELGLTEPHKCYDDHFRTYCCDTCSRVMRKDQRAEGCEYGDKDPKMCDVNLKPSDCYQPGVASTCCETCGRYRIEMTGCRYGDKATMCQRAVVRKSMCYDYNFTCCLTCPRLQVGLKGCEWGDRNLRCRGYSMSRCYETAFSRDCCDYCSQLRIGPPGCEWGDKVGSCTYEDCRNPARRKACCKTCSSQSKTTTTLTSPTAPTSISGETLSPTTKPTTAKPTSSTPSFTGKSKRSTTVSDERSTITTTAGNELSPTASLTDKPSRGSSVTDVPLSASTLGDDQPRKPTATDETSSTSSHRSSSTAIITDQPPSTSKSPSPVTSSPSTSASTETITKKPSPSSTTGGKTTSHPGLADQSLPADVLKADIIKVSEETCKDTSQYCYQIQGGRDCYSRHLDCCATCRQYETNNPICPYGDKISWCRHYVSEQGTRICDEDPFIRSECCASCGSEAVEMRQVVDEPCEDKATWCANIFSGQCYDTVTQKTCCAKCSSLRTNDVRCLFGDVYSWCSKTYCRTQARECCQTCKKP